jgi:hypothetical protein
MLNRLLNLLAFAAAGIYLEDFNFESLVTGSCLTLYFGASVKTLSLATLIVDKIVLNMFCDWTSDCQFVHTILEISKSEKLTCTKFIFIVDI